MIQFIILLLKFNVAIMALWLFYKLLLERLTFFVPVRFFLLAGILVSAFISLIKVEWFDSLFAGQVESANVGQYISSLQGLTDKELNLTPIILLVYGVGVLLFICNLFIQYLSYRKLKKYARPTELNGEKIYITNKNILPFSFGSSVFVSEKIISHPEIGQILSHEFIHIRQKHSIDILIAEIARIIGWFNPFAWMLKKAITQNLEFLTDAELLGSGIDKKCYQYLLLQFSGNRSFSLVTNFNFYSLKTRISKMNQNKSNQLQYSRFLLFIPMILVLMAVFSCMNDQTTDWSPEPKKTEDLKSAKLKLSEPVMELDGVNENSSQATNESARLKAKSKLREYTLKLDAPAPDQSKKSLLLQKTEKSSKQVVEELPPPPPPAMPRKR